MRRIINGEIVFNLDVIRRAGDVTKLNELNRTAARGEQEADDAEYEQSALQCAPHIVSPPAQVRTSVAPWRWAMNRIAFATMPIQRQQRI